MNNARNITLEKVASIIKNSTKSIYAITDVDGVEIDGKKRFFETAKIAFKKGSSVTKNGIRWMAFSIDKSTSGVLGLRVGKNTKGQAFMLEGLIDELSFEKFLEEQTNKYLDPKSDFVKELLTGESIKNMDQAIDKADILGLNLRSQQAVIIISIPGLFKKFHKKHKGQPREKTEIIIGEECEKILCSLKDSFNNYDQNIFTCLEPDTFLALKWARGQINTLNTISFYRKKAQYIQETIKKKTGITPTIGVGQYYPGLSGLRKSFVDAQTSLDLGTKIWGNEEIYHITDVGMFVAFSPNISFERKCELAHQIIGKLFEDTSLYKTVETFLDCDMNLTDAAKKLHLHRNTLIYRLDKIKKETGLDPKKFPDAIQIKLGILLYGPRTDNC